MWIGTLPPISEFLTALAFSSDGRTLLTGDRTGNVLVWDLARRTGRRLLRCREVDGSRAVGGVHPSPDGKELFVANRAGLTNVFAPTHEPVIAGEYTSWQLLAGGEALALDGDGRVCHWHLDSSYRFGLSASRCVLRAPLAQQQSIDTVRLLADGSTLLTCRGIGPAAKRLELWDFRAGARLGNFTPTSGAVTFFDAAPDAQSVVAARSRLVVVYDVATRRPGGVPTTSEFAAAFASTPTANCWSPRVKREPSSWTRARSPWCGNSISRSRGCTPWRSHQTG
jgi:WD40 repeat protein